MSGFGDVIDREIYENMWLLRLAHAAPTRLKEMMVEVERRAAVFREGWALRAGTERGIPAFETPQSAALQSVCHDVMHGWL